MVNVNLLTEPQSLTGWDNFHVIQTYFHNSDLQTRWALTSLSAYQFRGDEHILDFGSGDGKMTSILASYVPRGTVLGVDKFKGMADFASRLFPQYEYPRLSFSSFHDREFSEMEFQKQFDVITSFCVFQLVPNPKSIFIKLYHITKPGGKFIGTIPIGTNPAFSRARNELMAERGLKKADPSPEAALVRDPHLLRLMLTEIGYSVVKLEPIHVRYTFASKKELVDWCEGTLSGNWNIPNEGRRDFFETLVSLYCDYAPENCDEKGFIDFEFDRIDILASKPL